MTPTLSETRYRADQCINRYVVLAVGAGFLPSTLADMVALTGIEVALIRELARIYNYPVPGRLMAYKVLLSALSGVGTVYLTNSLQSTVKALPLVGQALYAGLFSLTGGVATYAVGKLFQEHYETGGTFLSAENAMLRAWFRRKLDEGRQAVPALLTFQPRPEDGAIP